MHALTVKLLMSCLQEKLTCDWRPVILALTLWWKVDERVNPTTKSGYYIFVSFSHYSRNYLPNPLHFIYMYASIFLCVFMLCVYVCVVCEIHVYVFTCICTYMYMCERNVFHEWHSCIHSQYPMNLYSSQFVTDVLIKYIYVYYFLRL